MAAPYYVYGGNLLNREKYTSVVNTPFGERRYFSNIDTEIYFGDILIDEMVAFDFIIDERKIPIFGYNNFTPKRLLTGQKNIQGSFAINFTQTFNLKLLIDGLPESIYANQYEEALFYCGDDNQALFGKGFDITLSYGDHKGEGSYNSCSQTLIGCYITSYRQALDTSGEPILDMYTFIAKDLIIQTSAEMEVPEEEENEPAENITDLDQKGPERYIIGNTNIPDEQKKVTEYCEEHSETLGVLINPQYKNVDGKHKMTISIIPLNRDELLLDSISIGITDLALKGSHTFKIDQRENTYNFYHDFTGTEVDIGAKIQKLFANGNDFLECIVNVECNDRTNSYSFSYETRLHNDDKLSH